MGAEPVLDGFDLRVRPGESVALVGATGSGKTTVARLIPRFYDVEAGRITLDGIDVRDLRLRDLRQAVGIVFEDTFLFSDTIAANIAFADPDAPHAAIERAARLAGRTSSSATWATATPPASVSGATRCRAGSGSGSPSSPSWPTRGC